MSNHEVSIVELQDHAVRWMSQVSVDERQALLEDEPDSEQARNY